MNSRRVKPPTFGIRVGMRTAGTPSKDPPNGGRTPARVRISVDFPLPLAPQSRMHSPGPISRLMPEMSGRPWPTVRSWVFSRFMAGLFYGAGECPG